VVGYVVNGGLSGYFSRRLGLLGQRVERMTMVTAAGEIRVLGTGDEELTSMLGAGSALGIVVDVTIRVAPASTIRHAEQRVFGFDTRDRAVRFTRGAVRLLRDAILPDPSVSQEIVVTGGGAIVVTTTFYDAFTGDPARILGPLEALGASLDLPLLAAARWGSWYEAAGALWPVIEGQSGDPLAFLCHAVGTRTAPDDAAIDYICDVMVGEAPLDEAQLSIIEIRTLGGAASTGRPIPTGNHHHPFFVDIVTMYDAAGKDGAARQAILDRTNRIVDRARTIPGLDVDFSGTHSQPDDPGDQPAAELIFGTPEEAASIRALKARLDPHDRFRFHPYARIIG
jgi:FAD/FMN-containing dehydrogenase